MKIVDLDAQLVWITPSAELVIERAGRTAYKSEDKITPASAELFIRKIIDLGHESVLEHASASIRFVCDRGCCYDAETEVLTSTEWKPWPLVTRDDKLACLDDNNRLQWHKPLKLHSYQFTGELLRFQSTNLDLLVTDNHKMWVFDYEKRSPITKCWKFLEARNLKNCRYKMTKTAIWEAPDCSITIPAHRTKFHSSPALSYGVDKTADLFELLGMWATDGSYRVGKKAGSCIEISQTKKQHVRRIKCLCKSLGFSVYHIKNSIRIDNLRLMDFVVSLFGLGPKSFRVRVPTLIKNASTRQIQRFLDGVVAGNGSIHKRHGHVVIYTASSGFAGDLQELYMKVGQSANVRTPTPRVCSFGNPNKPPAVMYVVSVHCQKTSVALLQRHSAKHFGTRVPYTGTVYCAEVPFHRLYVRRSGRPVWSGNSHELVRHRIASYTQESSRYCSYSSSKFNHEISVIQPHGLSPDQETTWRTACEAAEHAYMQLSEQGCAPQIARAVLPTCLKTEIVVTQNFRSWRHFFRLRCSKQAHPQMRHLALLAWSILNQQSTVCFGDVGPASLS